MIITACYTATTATASATEFKNKQCASRPFSWPGTVCWVEASTQVRAPERGPSTRDRTHERETARRDRRVTNPLSLPLPTPGHAELPDRNHSPIFSLQRHKNDARGSRDVATENESPSIGKREPSRARNPETRPHPSTEDQPRHGAKARTLTVLYIRD